MGLPAAEALSAIRISLGRWTTADQIDAACAHLADTIRHRVWSTVT
jgi:cysteine sulfinate desulfinase/cysteine desulfurase-like protein